ncbi:hypothetical protein AB0M28_30600 [Streptomyces sp. NPDC051940]|uniref:hypothetical protein n=1 Tax=Streptomyces sp. NPDC051940 TaxID=3155675 RepID=UPI003418191F
MTARWDPDAQAWVEEPDAGGAPPPPVPAAPPPVVPGPRDGGAWPAAPGSETDGRGAAPADVPTARIGPVVPATPPPSGETPPPSGDGGSGAATEPLDELPTVIGGPPEGAGVLPPPVQPSAVPGYPAGPESSASPGYPVAPESPAYPVAPGPHEPGGPAPRGTATVVAIVLATVIVVAGGAVGYLLLKDDDGGGKGARPSPSVSASAGEGTPSPTDPETSTDSPSPSDSGEGRVPPEGYLFMTEPDFLTVAPEGWQRDVRDTITWYRSPDDPERTLVQVWKASEQVDSPMDLVDLAENGERGLASRPEYVQHARGEVAGEDAAELDYSWVGENGGVRGLYRAMRMPDGELWVVVVSGAPEAWPRQQETQQAVLDYFCLTGQCDYEPVYD